MVIFILIFAVLIAVAVLFVAWPVLHMRERPRRARIAMVEASPTPAIHEVVRWRLIDLAQWVFDEYDLSVSKQILSRELRALGYRKLSAWPRHHAQKPEDAEAFKKRASLPRWTRSARLSRPVPQSKSGGLTKLE